MSQKCMWAVQRLVIIFCPGLFAVDTVKSTAIRHHESPDQCQPGNYRIEGASFGQDPNPAVVVTVGCLDTSHDLGRFFFLLLALADKHLYMMNVFFFPLWF